MLAHPECKGAVLKLADVVGSTAALLKYAIRHERKEFIVATESGILHEMQKACPEKTFIPAPPDDSTCACNECNYMRLITLEKLYNTLKYEWPEIVVDAEVAEKAVKGWMGKVGTFPQHLPSSLFLRGEGAAFQKTAPRKEGGGLAGGDQAGGF